MLIILVCYWMYKFLSIMENDCIQKLPHHMEQSLCHTRSSYRKGRNLTAVKVYTINDESQHLIVCGVPKLNLITELTEKLSQYGAMKRIAILPDYSNIDFMETYHVHYNELHNARISKHFLDGLNFFGTILHIFYVPELESLLETKTKLLQRRKNVESRIMKQKSYN